VAIRCVVEQEESSKTEYISGHFALYRHRDDAPSVVSGIGEIRSIRIVGCVAILINAVGKIGGHRGFCSPHSWKNFAHCETLFLKGALDLLADDGGAVITPEASRRRQVSSPKAGLTRGKIAVGSGV